jgi:hypothetical protein
MIPFHQSLIIRQLRQKQIEGYLRFVKKEREGGSIKKPCRPNKKNTRLNFGVDIGIMIPFHQSLFTLFIKNKQIFDNGLHTFLYVFQNACVVSSGYLFGIF